MRHNHTPNSSRINWSKVCQIFWERISPIASPAIALGGVALAAYASVQGSNYSDSHNKQVLVCARDYTNTDRQNDVYRFEVDERCRPFFGDYLLPPVAGTLTVTPQTYRLPRNLDFVDDQLWGEEQDAAHTQYLYEGAMGIVGVGAALQLAAGLRYKSRHPQSLETVLQGILERGE